MKRIFIGGMGRSGTTILLHALYQHGEVYTVPIETKFLVEEDGFDDLITALTSRFSPAGAAIALKRFQELMFQQVTGVVDSKFRQQRHVPSTVFGDYNQALEDFMHGLSEDAFYFSDRGTLLALTRSFVASLFDTETRRSDKWIWAEKTPANYWRLPFLRELWPDCYFIHAIRDPRGIFLSLMERRWLPADVSHALVLFASHMTALLRLRRAYIGTGGFIEVRLEDLVGAPESTLQKLTAALGLRSFDPPATEAIVRTMGAYYANKDLLGFTLNAREQTMMNELLLPAVTELGYPRCWQPSHATV